MKCLVAKLILRPTEDFGRLFKRWRLEQRRLTSSRKIRSDLKNIHASARKNGNREELEFASVACPLAAKR
jgi:hypothetical protein